MFEDPGKYYTLLEIVAFVELFERKIQVPVAGCLVLLKTEDIPRDLLELLMNNEHFRNYQNN